MSKIKSLLRKTAKQVLDSMFERAKARLMGRFYDGPKVFIKIIKDFGVKNSLEGATTHSLMHHAGTGLRPNDEVLQAHAEEAQALLDSVKSKTYKKILQDIKVGDTDAIKKTFDTAQHETNRIIFHEITTAQSIGGQQGVVEVARSKNIEDPTVAWIGPLDAKTCASCLEMYHTSENPMIPRVWKLSELKQGYFKRKEWDGKSVYSKAHPRCRHVMTIIMDGFGFDNSGSLTYIGDGHDEFSHQRKHNNPPQPAGLKKSECCNH